MIHQLNEKTMTTIIEKAKELVTKLETNQLALFAVTAPDEVLNIVLDELEKRMTESEFVKLCETL